MEYFLTTLDAKIYYVKFSVDKQKLSIAKRVRARSSIPDERYSSFGIAASRNRALFYIALYPQQVYFQSYTVRMFLKYLFFYSTELRPLGLAATIDDSVKSIFRS